MPPRTRTRATKDSKENVDVMKKAKARNDGKIKKPPRKALADKTNSLSDDNASIDVPIKTKVVLKNKTAKSISKDELRPRRDRRLPTRYVENQVLNNLSNSKETQPKNQSSDTLPTKPTSKDEKVKQHPSVETEPIRTRPKRNCRLQSVKEPPAPKKPETPSKQSITTSPFKTPSKSFDSSLVANKPKRICRLPSKFEDHSISPHKFIPVQPCHASTPIVKKNTQRPKSNDNVAKTVPEKRPTRKDKGNVNKDVKNTNSIERYLSKSKTNTVKDTLSSSKDKASPDTNNNPKSTRTSKKAFAQSSSKQVSPKANIKTGFTKRLLEKNLSFRVFEDRKSQDKNEDIYEFTFDPKDEPPPQKKKRKRVVRKKPTKPKAFVLKNNYDINVQKALDSLITKVKPSQHQTSQLKPQSQGTQSQNVKPDINPPGKVQIIEDIILKPATENILNNTPAPVNDTKSIHMSNYASIHVEDIAADFEVSDNNDINYSPVNSPVNSPCRPKTPEIQEDNCNTNAEMANSHAVNNKDPLNLQGDVSFFDEQPVASSSMNISVRNPLASPWRVEFGNLPIRWQANTYVKSNMTPAVESSFINSEEISKKKHVYTNLVAEEPLPPIDDPPQLKQTSIISFMREVAERSLKKKRGRSISPTKANSLFEDVSNTSFGFKTPKKARKEKVATPNVSDNSNDKSCEKEASHHNENHDNSNKNHDNSNENYDNSNENSNPKDNSNQSSKSPKKKSKKNKDGTYFGFDDSCDQENVSPIKNVHNTRARGLRSKSRAVLQEINTMKGPTRAVLPVKPKLASSEIVEKLYEQLKSSEEIPEDVPQLPEKEKVVEANDEPLSDDDDDQSVHLFEDIEVVHHLKPQRKSYGKAKKVAFRQRSNSDSDTQTQSPDDRLSYDDDLADLTFYMPNVKEKKVTKKKKPKNQLSKKEDKEVEEWAAGFNSMCEDVDEFPLVFE